jgi:nucleoside-diphosphate-sugar epimerase
MGLLRLLTFGVAILGPEPSKFWHDHKGARLNAIRTRKAIGDADISRAARDLDFAPKTSLREGIARNSPSFPSISFTSRTTNV